ncbi:MAG: hypothetical protein ACLQPD_22470 [Desulfomonilaceae bacterium]
MAIAIIPVAAGVPAGRIERIMGTRQGVKRRQTCGGIRFLKSRVLPGTTWLAVN